ncbi:MAG: cytochrome c3 family protein [Armatimonadota bacterium]|nr:cytochrome c3 family protein [Armatimonadota bacterium]
MRIPAIKSSLPGRPAAILSAVALLLAMGLGLYLQSLRAGPAQPIPFSHNLHVTSKKLNCFFCHPYATESSNAGMPPVEKCLLCHNVIAAQWEPIAKIHKYKRMGKGIPWVRVNKVPDFTHFSHQAHLAREFDCGVCHGNVAEMDRVYQANKFTMGFCVDCHKENNASIDCYTCHY